MAASRSGLFKLSLGLYAVSLLLPAVGGLEGDSSIPGFACLFMLPFVALYPAWWANLFYCVAVKFFVNGFAFQSRLFSTVAVLLSATIAFCVDLKTGAFVWFASLVMMVAASSLEQKTQQTFRS